MRCVLKGAKVFFNGAFSVLDVRIVDGLVAEVSANLVPADGETVYALQDMFVFPGFMDAHVHLREPGFSYKENVRTGTLAAAHGGYTAVCSMPNLKPVPDCLAGLVMQKTAIEKDALVHVYPYGAITAGQKGELLSDMDELAPYVIAFSDDGKGVQSAEMMEKAMLKAKSLNKMIVAHCEDESLLSNVCVHEGAFSRKLGVAGNTGLSEAGQVARDLELVRKTGAKYHVCHVSAKETVALIRKAKAEGLDVTCETGPHYLVLNDEMLSDHGRFRMNPPIRTEEDRLALVEGLLDGTVDMVATDHAPHAAQEKDCPFVNALNGVVGLECAFPVLYTHLIRTGKMKLETLIDRMALSPRRRFGVPGGIEVGQPADLTVWSLETEETVDPNAFLSMGKSTPFEGMKVYARCQMTLVGGNAVWQK